MPLNGYSHASDIEKHLEAPMPWIGIYVASSSLICTLLISADLFIGLRAKKLWFPSKFFSLNATSLTLLAVSMKLPVDLTTRMWSPTDRLAKISSMIFLSTAIGNFMICLGSMDDKEILMNVTALGILVITVIVNVCVQIIQMHGFLKGRKMFPEEVIAAVSMLVLLVMMVSTAVMVPRIKKYLESKYREMLKVASQEQALDCMEEGNSTSIEKLRLMIQKYWVMAETSQPQFAIARSSNCTASGVVCIFVALLLIQAEVRMILKCKRINMTASKYGWSVKWIVLAHSIAVIVGTIAPAFRFLTAIKLKIDERGYTSFRDELKVDAYWIQRLVEWKESSLPLHIRERRWRKILHGAKRLVLDFLIRVQICVVLMSKVISFASLCLLKPVIVSLRFVRSLMRVFATGSSSLVHDISESEPGARRVELNLTRYILLLEGEAELPRKVQVSICNEVDELIQRGKKQKPKNLIKLLHKIGNFRGLKEVNQSRVPSLHSKEPPNCWSLPLVTLTSIAMALPNISKDRVCSLLSSMDEGIFYVNLIEKTLDKKGKIANSRNAADVIWVGVELYRRWQDSDLHETSLKGKSSKETLQELSNKAERTILEFKRDEDFLMENPLNWPVNVVAANSMYQICQRLLLAYESDYLQTDERLFEQLCNMIANILGACLTNLMHVITIKCHHKDIKVKAKSVHRAALLLGETEEILEILQQQRATISDPEETEFIERWCNLIKKKL